MQVCIHLLRVQFKVCHGSPYAVMWLADEPREFNLPTLPQRRIIYEPEKLPNKYGVHSEEYVPIRTENIQCVLWLADNTQSFSRVKRSFQTERDRTPLIRDSFLHWDRQQHGAPYTSIFDEADTPQPPRSPDLQFAAKIEDSEDEANYVETSQSGNLPPKLRIQRMTQTTSKLVNQPIRGGPPAWGLSEGLTTHHRKKQLVTKPNNKPRNGTDSPARPQQRNKVIRFGKMDLREVGYDGRDWINLARDRDQWRAYVKAAMNLRIP
ncbi:hypothetical protein ANN_22249 [Periplaneta americana]|uniref:Uncharacterized protein n=1 Tax=Periplaneta americana TaxID=6978 RepID=A0ABQ8S8D2_PERAM|nr:hypothetical protein ANN_22249 [Periplaneta americana]